MRVVFETKKSRKFFVGDKWKLFTQKLLSEGNIFTMIGGQTVQPTVEQLQLLIQRDVVDGYGVANLTYFSKVCPDSSGKFTVCRHSLNLVPTFIGFDSMFIDSLEKCSVRAPDEYLNVEGQLKAIKGFIHIVDDSFLVEQLKSAGEITIYLGNKVLWGRKVSTPIEDDPVLDSIYDNLEYLKE